MKLEQLKKDNLVNPSLVNSRVIERVIDPDVLLLAYGNIKSNPGNMSPGSSPDT